MDNVEQLHALTASQKGLLYQTLLGETDAVYRTQSRFDIVGPLDLICFRRSIDFLVERHGMLRSLVLHVGLDEPALVIKTHVDVPWRESDFSGVGEQEQLERLDQLAVDSFAEPFQLDVAPLIRFTVAKLSSETTHIILDIHHLIFDGWSSVLFFSELQSVYAALLDDRDPGLAPAGNYISHVQRVNAVDPEQSESVWRSKLTGFTHPTAMPRAHQSGAGVYATGNFRDYLDAETTRRLEEVAREQRVTLNTLVQAAWALVLSRYNDTEDVLFGVTVNGRSLTMQEHERTFGLFSNTLPLRIRSAAETSISQWLRHVQAELTTLVQFENSSLADVHQFSDVPAGVDLFESLLVFQSFPHVEHDVAPALAVVNARVHENSPLPLTIEVFHGYELGFLIMYMEERFAEENLRQVIDHFKNLLLELSQLGEVSGKVADLQMTTAQEQVDLLALIGQTERSAAAALPYQTLHQGFYHRALLAEDTLAVQGYTTAGEIESLSYTELANLAKGVALHLSENGVHPGDCVAVCVDRSIWMIPIILGMLDSGAKWLPLDNTYPLDRLAFMLEDSGASLMIVDDAAPAGLHKACESSGTVRSLYLSELLRSAESRRSVIDLHEVRGKGSSGAPGSQPDAAYLMYTSGSTGTPKGVIGSHSATLNRLAWGWNKMPYHQHEVCCQKAALSFVDSVAEIFSPLLAGVPLLVLPEEVIRDPLRFVDELEKNHITRILLVPSLLGVLLDTHPDLPQRLQALRICSVSGEPLSESVANHFLTQFENCALYNLYGSTEVTADVTWLQVTDGNLNTPMPIGAPLDGNRIFLIDSHHKLAPLGAVAEIAVAGHGLSLGYHNDDALNSSRFVELPGLAQRVFLTGDLGVVENNGILTHLGRRDKQFKIRGQRVESAEIEHCMLRHEGVSQAVVSLYMGEQVLGYYSVKAEHSVAPEALLETLRDSLPRHMVPWQLVEMAEIPRLPNGKTDYQTLPLPQESASSNGSAQVSPRTETEQKVADAWREILGGEEPSVTANFVASGGTSLTGMRLNARLYREFGKMIMPRMLLSASLAQLALSINPDDAPDTGGVMVIKDKMSPTYVGPADSSIYTVLHEPQDEPVHQAVLICPTIGADYMRSHRTLQMVAVELARQGFHVLRFDLFGVGDSYGSPKEASIDRWQRDIRLAAEHLHEVSQCATLHVVSLRLGVPLLLAADLQNIQKMILWDPEWTGQSFLQRQQHLHQRAMRDLDRYRFRQRRSAPGELFGYTWSIELLQELEKLNSDSFKPGAAKHVTVIKTGQHATTDKTVESIRQKVSNLELQLLLDVTAWNDYHEAGNLLLANPVVQQINRSLVK